MLNRPDLLILTAVLISFCVVVSAEPLPAERTGQYEVPKVDQISFANQLKVLRPDLFFTDCKNNLILKPRYRFQVLAGRNSWESLLNHEYSRELQHRDRSWADRHRSAVISAHQRSAEGVSLADYPVERFVGYHVGNGNLIKDGKGSEFRVTYKVYFELKSFEKALTPETYFNFSRALYAAGFSGDSKIQLAPGNARYHFNNIVVHANSRVDALTAERVGLGFFQGQLASRGRGLDVFIEKSRSADWNTFLCLGDLSKLPVDAVRFTKYE